MEIGPTNAMNDDWRRSITFVQYPLPELEGVPLSSLLSENYPITFFSSAGFYRIQGGDDEIRCYSCCLKVKCRGWQGVKPLTLHRILSPTCRHVKKLTPALPSASVTNPAAVEVVRRLSDDYNEAAANQTDGLGRNQGRHPGREGEIVVSFLFESHRLLSFNSPTHPKAKEWAGEGFIYKEENRMVICVFCGLELQYNTTTPGIFHKQQSPDCPLVNVSKESENITMELENRVKSRYLGLSNRSNSQLILHPQFMEETIRLETFRSWPRQLTQTAPEMCRAGFFFSESADKVVCFACGCSIWNWDPEDDPWIHHAHSSPHCVFVQREMGDNFIAEAQRCQVMTACDPPPNSWSDLGSPTCPLRLTLDAKVIEGIKLAMTRQYDIQQIRVAVLLFYRAFRGFYPGGFLLQKGLQGLDINFRELQKQGGQLLNQKNINQKKEQVIEEKEQVIVEKEQVIVEKEHANQTLLQASYRREREFRLTLNEVTQNENALRQRLLTSAQEMERQTEEMERQAVEMERLRKLLQANNISYNGVTE